MFVLNKNKYELFPNPNGVVYKVTIDKKCCKCGACIGFSDMFEDSDTGKPYLNHRGLFTFELKDLIDDVADICPVSAIVYNTVSTVNSNSKPTLNELKINVHNKICNYKFQKPDYEDYSWGFYGINLDCGSCVSYDNYSSESRARSAGLELLDNKYFKRADALCTETLSEFKNTRLRSLLEYNEDKGNYYYEHEQDVNAYMFVLLNEILNLTGYSFIEDKDFYPVILYNRNGKTEFASFERNYRYLQRNVKSKWWYESYIECDSFDDLVEVGPFNKLKEKKKYNYNILEAIFKIEDQIRENSKENIKEAFYNTWDSQKYGLSEYERKFKSVGEKIIDVLKGNDSYPKNKTSYVDLGVAALAADISIKPQSNTILTAYEKIRTEVLLIEDYFSITDKGTIVCGKVKNKNIQVEDKVIINNKMYIASGIEVFRRTLDHANPGLNIGLLVSGLKREDVSVGDVVYLIEE